MALQEHVMNDQSSASHPVEKTATEARQGATTGTVRWVLAISVVGAIIAMVVVYGLVHGV
jgi:hypothetical protein